MQKRERFVRLRVHSCILGKLHHIYQDPDGRKHSGILRVLSSFVQRAGAARKVMRKEIRMKSLLIRGIKLYQKYLSPLKRTRCPYIPSCSQYGLEAIQKYGAFKGGLLAVVENFEVQSIFKRRS